MNDAEFQRLLDTEAPVVLIPSDMKLIRLLFSGFVFLGATNMVIHAIIAQDYTGASWGTVFGIGIVWFVWRILAPKNFSLILNHENFIPKITWSKYNCRWENASEFIIRPWSGYQRVFFNDNSNKSKFRKLMQGAYNVMFPFNYGGLTADQLAQLMNHWRERALSGK